MNGKRLLSASLITNLLFVALLATGATKAPPADRTAPFEFAGAVTPSDVTSFTYESRALWIGGAGNISLRMRDYDTGEAADVTLTGVPAGTTISAAVDRVNSTGTTATGIVKVR